MQQGDVAYMCRLTIVQFLIQRPWLLAGLIVLVIIVMALPYEYVVSRQGGHTVRRWRSTLWVYLQRPHLTYVRVDGIWALQKGVVQVCSHIWKTAQRYLSSQLWHALRRWLMRQFDKT